MAFFKRKPATSPPDAKAALSPSLLLKERVLTAEGWLRRHQYISQQAKKKKA